MWGLKKIEAASATDDEFEGGAFHSRFGGLWTDRRDAHALLAQKVQRGEVTQEDADAIAQFIDHGYVIFRNCVDSRLIDDYLRFFEQSFVRPPPGIYAHTDQQVVELSHALYDKVAKVSDLHYYYPKAGRLIFAARIRRFLTKIYERPPVVFQTMTLRKGSQEPLHTDTGPLTLTEPLSLTASWIALEDVKSDAGPLEYVPGSHRVPECLNKGVSKGHNGDMAAYYEVLQTLRNRCVERGLKTEQFLARKGDVLIWAADLLHGGAPISNPTATRKSLVSHYMPFGVMATFYDFSALNYITYPEGGYHIDRIKAGE
jgi:ectoine hydroxylase-related dioxygenase (phytanoyl-CoA dioxygenase family)